MCDGVRLVWCSIFKSSSIPIQFQISESGRVHARRGRESIHQIQDTLSALGKTSWHPLFDFQLVFRDVLKRRGLRIEAAPAMKGLQKVPSPFWHADVGTSSLGPYSRPDHLHTAQCRPLPVSRASALRAYTSKVLSPPSLAAIWDEVLQGSPAHNRQNGWLFWRSSLLISDKPQPRIRSPLRARPLATIQTSDEISNVPSFNARSFLDFGRT
jgi:hypothetical protein